MDLLVLSFTYDILTKTSQPIRKEIEENLNLFNLITQPSKKVFSHWMGGTFWMKH